MDSFFDIVLDIIDGLKEAIPGCVKQGVNDALAELTLKAEEKRSFLDLKNAFICVVCQNTARPEVIVSMCCSSILGCKACVDRWFQESNTCPKCRVDQNETLHHPLKGFDDALLRLSRFNQ